MASSALHGAAPRAAMLRHVLLAARAGGRPDAGGTAKLGVAARPEVAGLLFGPLGWSLSGQGLATTGAVLAPGGPGQDRPGGGGGRHDQRARCLLFSGEVGRARHLPGPLLPRPHVAHVLPAFRNLFRRGLPVRA